LVDLADVVYAERCCCVGPVGWRVGIGVAAALHAAGTIEILRGAAF